MIEEEPLEVLALDHVERHVGPGGHRGGPRPVEEEGDLAEELSGSPDRDEPVARADLRLARQDHEELTSRCHLPR